MTNDTICALATAPGGALGIIRVSGPAAFSAVCPLCAVRCDRITAISNVYQTMSRSTLNTK